MQPETSGPSSTHQWSSTSLGTTWAHVPSTSGPTPAWETQAPECSGPDSTHQWADNSSRTLYTPNVLTNGPTPAPGPQEPSLLCQNLGSSSTHQQTNTSCRNSEPCSQICQEPAPHQKADSRSKTLDTQPLTLQPGSNHHWVSTSLGIPWAVAPPTSKLTPALGHTESLSQQPQYWATLNTFWTYQTLQLACQEMALIIGRQTLNQRLLAPQSVTLWPSSAHQRA